MENEQIPLYKLIYLALNNKLVLSNLTKPSSERRIYTLSVKANYFVYYFSQQKYFFKNIEEFIIFASFNEKSKVLGYTIFEK